MQHGHLKWQLPMASQIHLSFPYVGPSKRRSTTGLQRSAACIKWHKQRCKLHHADSSASSGGFSELQCGLRHLLGFFFFFFFFFCCQSLLSFCGSWAEWEWCPTTCRVSLHLPWHGSSILGEIPKITSPGLS